MDRSRKKTPPRRSPVVHRDALGQSPGTLRARPGAHPSTLSVVAYSKNDLVEETDPTPERIAELRASHSVTWVNLDGLADAGVIERLGEQFGLHRLALEDALNVPQRPKMDDYENHHYIVVLMPVSAQTLDTEQVSLFLAPGLLLTVQERPGDCLEGVRRRIRDGRPRLREGDSDYLAYAVLDAIVDAYFPPLEEILSRLDELESTIVEEQRTNVPAHLQEARRVMATTRRHLGPLTEVTGALLREDDSPLNERTRIYMRDCHDHARHAIEILDAARETASGLMNLHLSLLSQRMNEVMKVLTVIATVFIPLSFLAGLYGMNFDPDVSPWNMPELGWAYGYPAALAVMALVAGGMFVFFARKGWFR